MERRTGNRYFLLFFPHLLPMFTISRFAVKQVSLYLALLLLLPLIVDDMFTRADPQKSFS